MNISSMVIGGVAVTIGVLFSAWLSAAAPWKSECFGTLDAMVVRMNQRPDADMHVVSVPSQRNAGGWFGSPYCLVMR
jgi:hypothetical protein